MSKELKDFSHRQLAQIVLNLVRGIVSRDSIINGHPCESLAGVPIRVLLRESLAGVPIRVFLRESLAGVPIRVLLRESLAGVPIRVLLRESLAGVPIRVLLRESLAGVPIRVLLRESLAGVPIPQSRRGISSASPRVGRALTGRNPIRSGAGN